MSVNVYIPTPFRHLVGNRAAVSAEGTTVMDVFESLDTQFPGFHAQLFDGGGALAQHISVYVNQVEIRSLEGMSTNMSEGDELAVIPALAGGADVSLTPDMVERYSRHLIMPQVGSIGQRKIIGSKVLIVGAGGLGSPVALYLALAGVGTIGIIDFDVVDASNLQRQVLHLNDSVGRPKVESAKDTLLSHNPNVEVVTHEEPIVSDNAFRLIEPYDIVVNGADNFATRYLVNDACYLLKKPLVDGSILMFDGQATTYMPGQGCYRCLYPAPPPPGMVPSCAEAGVLGAMCATVGSIQTTEVLKLILGVGEPLVNRLLLYDALSLEFRIVKIRRDPECPLCGDNPTLDELIDYEAFCGVPLEHAISNG
ncbi:MAG TPA: molybdopterin-synthase adenylyltransferase MoeB [Dehalococcoidia bacterium]|nr:molybdopterin-synthase adenylyltransferase MoeB [Dehalococcoidia bacterium]